MTYNKPTIFSGTSGDLLIHHGPAKPAFFIPGCNVHHVLEEDGPPAHIALTDHLPLAVIHAIASSIVDIWVLPGESIPSFGASLKTGWRFGYTDSRSDFSMRQFADRHRLHLVCTPDRSFLPTLGLARLGASHLHLARHWEETTRNTPPPAAGVTPPCWPTIRDIVRKAHDQQALPPLHHLPESIQDN